jgi:membrane protein implicated in regulation of membrane protease activity
MKAIKQLNAVFLLAGMGYLGFYVYGLVMGAFAPLELLGFTVVAIVFAVLFAIHAVRVSRAMRDDDGFRHSEMRRQHELRQRRGF